MTNLIPQPNLEKLTASGEISFGDLMDALARANFSEQVTGEAPAAVTVRISISDDQRILLRRLAVQLAEIALPDSPRELTETEKHEFIQIFTDVKSSKDAIVSAESALKETFANHLDVEAWAKAGDDAALPIDEHGHVLAPGEVTASGVSTKVTRELRGGKANPLSIADLQRLEASGEIDHATFLKMTEAVPATRRVDEAKIMDLLAVRPELLKVLASVATLSNKTASYYVRKAK
jgi:hypothetical protein